MSTSSRRGQIVFRSISVAIALFLFATAALKAHGLIVDPLKSELQGVPPSIQLLAIEIEFVLGLCLVSGLRVKWALIATTCFFLLATGTTAIRAADQQPSCACFGSLGVNPVYTLILDVAVCAVLIGMVIFC